MGDRKMHGIGSRADYSCYRCPYGSSPDRRSDQPYRTLAANRAASRRTVAAKFTAANFRADEIEECGFTASVETLDRCDDQVSFRTGSDNRNNLLYSQFRAFFDRPFHAVKFENRKCEGNVGDSNCRDVLAQFKLNSIVVDAGNPTSPNITSRGNIEFLPDPGTKHPCQMLGVRAGKSCAIAGNFVGDPAASRHALKKNNHQGDEDTRRKALQKFLRVPLCFVPLVIKWLRRG